MPSFTDVLSNNRNYQPILATSMAVLILGERVTMPLIAGGAVIFAGVYLTERG